MTTFIALLRGVNLGPYKRVAMADLRAALAAGGFDGARTHLQSGNVVLDSDCAASDLGASIESVLERELGLQTSVVMRTAEQLSAAIAADPLGAIATNPSRHVLGFCAAAPSAETVTAVEARIAVLRERRPDALDRHAFAGEHFYLWCPEGISASPYFTVPWDKLGTVTTQRNWNTVTALARMVT